MSLAHRESCHTHGMALIVWWPREIRTVEVSKAYFPQEGNIQIHQSRVKPCPPGFPSGYYWYGTRKKSAGRPPKVQNSANKSVLDPPKDGADPKKSKGAGRPPKKKHTARNLKRKSSIKNVNSTETMSTARVELEPERGVM